MKAIAPGKLILSGEHAVVYGHPALAMAVDRCAQSVITPDTDGSELVHFDLLDYHASGSYTLFALREFRSRVIKNYRMFLNGELGIRDVLHKPVDLLEFAFIIFIEGLQLKLHEGMRIKLQSNIPIGCGMGSSAATILSTMRAVANHLGLDVNKERYFSLGLEAEKLQHGHPSGVDSYVSLNGGCVKFTNDEKTSIPLPRLPLFMVQTGVPDATTGECVVKVRDSHADSRIWNDFAAVTAAFEEALLSNDDEKLRACIRENHRLLTEIGVVPAKVQEFIDELNKEGAAGKICGAGSVKGDKAGVVLVSAEKPPVELCDKYGFTVRPLRGDPLGARIVA